MERTRFIVFEGIDGSGKTTLLEKVRKELVERGVRVGVTKSLLPDTEIGISLRKWISNPINEGNNLLITSQFTTAILEANSRLLDMMNSGEYDIILSDRWLLSTYVYGTYGADDAKLNRICRNLIDIADGFVETPDHTVYVDCLPKVAVDRLKARDNSLDTDIFTSLDKLIDYWDMYNNILNRPGFSPYSKSYGRYENSDNIVDDCKHLAVVDYLMEILDKD